MREGELNMEEVIARESAENKENMKKPELKEMFESASKFAECFVELKKAENA